jgi:hypothetical protein
MASISFGAFPLRFDRFAIVTFLEAVLGRLFVKGG